VAGYSGALALGAPWFLRRRAIKRMQAEGERRSLGISATTSG
jgi:hypothetical protein